MSGAFTSAALDDCGVPVLGFIADIHADAAYRAYLVAVMARRAGGGP